MSTQSPASNDLFLLDCNKDFHHFALKLLAQTHRNVAILSRELDLPIFNSDEFVEALSQIARNNRHAHIQILVKDTQPLIAHGHKLIRLTQRLSSKISLRKLTVEPSDKNMGFMLCDSQSLLYKNDDANYQGFANFNAAAEVKHFREIFDYIWQYGEASQEFQELHI